MVAAKPRTVLVLYGSETGNAQDIAEEVGKMCQRLHFESTVQDMDGAELVRMPFSLDCASRADMGPPMYSQLCLRMSW